MVCENLGEPKNINEIILKQEITKKIVIMVPYAAQGHVTPMLKLASYLSTLGLFQPLMVLPEFIHRRIISKMDLTRAGIRCLSIPDGLDEGKPCDFFAIETAMEDCMPAHLSRLIRKLQDDDHEEVGCLIVDVLASWAIEVGRECSVEVAGFWTAMVAAYSLISSFPELIQRGLISEAGKYTTMCYDICICFFCYLGFRNSEFLQSKMLSRFMEFTIIRFVNQVLKG